MESKYYNLEKSIVSKDISTIFKDWKANDERVAIFSPHDDDALLGAGYLILNAIQNKAEVYVIIFCNGSAGYSKLEDKNEIIGVRGKETLEAYALLGIPEKNIIRLNYEDFSVLPNIGYKLINGEDGAFSKIVKLMRNLKITRAVIPNGYREHIDHEAVFKISSYDAIQAGDPIFCDWGASDPIRSMLQYSVWADFNPVNGLSLNNGLKADRVISVSAEYENKICEGIYKFDSQKEIIKDLVKQREKRKSGASYIEVYYEFNGRPQLEYKPYINAVEMINKG